MVDPVVLVLVAGSVAGAFGAVVATVRERMRTQDIRRKAQQAMDQFSGLNRELHNTNHKVTSLEWDLQHAKKTFSMVEQERDKFRKIAESHEVKYQKDPPPPKREKIVVWSQRAFRGHPADNLHHMAQEMREYLDAEVVLTVSLSPSEMGQTGFAKAVQGRRHGTYEFHGTGRRALSDLGTYLMDEDTGFTKPGPKRKRKDKVRASADNELLDLCEVETEDSAVNWVDDDSPLPMTVSLQHIKVTEPHLPVIHTVEVAVVTTEVQVVEKPVVIKVPEGQEADLCGHTKEEIATLVDDALARRIAEIEVDQADRAITRVAARAASRQKTMM